jgi:predicted RNA-binding Zn ribbon-like protein
LDGFHETVYRLSSVMYEDIGHCEPAPAASLERARRFINTVNRLHDREYLPDAATFQRVCLELGLPDPGLVDDADLRRVRSVREALRALAATHNEGPEVDSAEVLAHQARRSGLQISFAEDAAPIVVEADGADGVLGTVLASIAESMRDGHWQRMKACRNERCRWVFYDHSRNRTGIWCSMRVCGNRHKVRAHRARQAAAG